MKSMDAYRANDKIGTYSSRGPSRLDMVIKPDIVAPDNKVISISANGTPLYKHNSANLIPLDMYSTSSTGGSNSNKYFRLSGTSMAAPVVSGSVALLLQKDPTLTPDTVKARLMISANKWAQPDGTADPCTFGAGYLNIPAALQCLEMATQPALSPALIRESLATSWWTSPASCGAPATNK